VAPSVNALILENLMWCPKRAGRVRGNLTFFLKKKGNWTFSTFLFGGQTETSRRLNFRRKRHDFFFDEVLRRKKKDMISLVCNVAGARKKISRTEDIDKAITQVENEMGSYLKERNGKVSLWMCNRLDEGAPSRYVRPCFRSWT